MAVLTTQELAGLRRSTRTDWTTSIDFDKSTINAAFQKIEDSYENQRGPLSGQINSATAPKMFTAAEKKLLSKAHQQFKHGQGG